MIASPTTTIEAARRTVSSVLLGALTVTEDQLFTFGDGLLGFPTCREWVLIQGAKAGTAWLQSVDHGALAFLLVDPFVMFEGYSAELSPAEVRRLEASDPSHLAVFAIVTLPASRSESATANLQGPVVVNVRDRRGAQVVLSEGPWSVRQALPQTVLG
jgi:flagellar assembly factor FliW